MEELDDQQPVYEFFTIINDNDGTEELNEEQSNKVVYLTFCGDDEEASTSDVKTIENEPDDFNELQTIDPNVKIIKLDNGEFYVTTTNSTDENLESINPILVNEETSIEEPNKDNVADLTDVDALNLDCKYEIVGLLDEPLMVYCDENTTNTTNEVVKEKKFKCYYEGCDKEYASPYQLNIHLRVHMDCKPYECTVEGCDKKFSTNYSLKAHIRTHTGEKPYGCVICYKHFKTSGDLQKHLRTHTGEKPFMCPIEGCGKSFTTSNIRKVHIRSHTGERPYTCNYPHCGKAFSSSTNYKNHVRIHSGEKPYVCQVDGCSKRFTEYSSLYKHNMVHQTSRPAVCRFCGQKFKHDSAMKLHKRVKHNVVLASDGTEIVVDLN